MWLDNLKLTFNLFPYNLDIFYLNYFSSKIGKKISNTLTRSNRLKSVNRTWTILRNQSSSCWTRRSKTQSIRWERKLNIWTTRQRGKSEGTSSTYFPTHPRRYRRRRQHVVRADTRSKYVNWAEENPFCLRTRLRLSSEAKNHYSVAKNNTQHSRTHISTILILLYSRLTRHMGRAPALNAIEWWWEFSTTKNNTFAFGTSRMLLLLCVVVFIVVVVIIAQFEDCGCEYTRMCVVTFTAVERWKLFFTFSQFFSFSLLSVFSPHYSTVSRAH